MSLRRHSTVSRRPLALRGFVPADIGGSLLWLQSDKGITLNAGNVSGWADQRGAYGLTANNASQGTTANQPAYVASGGGGGKPYLSFAGAAGTHVLLGTSVFNQPLHVFVACNSSKSANSAYVFDGGGNNNAIFEGANLLTTNFYAGTVIAGPSFTQGADCVYEAFFSGASSFARINGGAQSTGNPGTGTSAVPYGIGNFTGGSNEWGGRTYAVLVYGRQLSAAEALAVRQYLYSLYGIAGS